MAELHEDRYPYAGNNKALKDGTVTPKTFTFEFIDVPVLIDGFRRMVRGLEFDICEMAITTYICARDHGKKLHRAADLPGAPIPPRRDPGEHESRDPLAERLRRETRRRQPRLHGDDRRVGARDPRLAIRRRPRQDHLGALGRRARRRVQAAEQRRPHREREGHGQDARVGRAGRRDRRRREASRHRAARYRTPPRPDSKRCARAATTRSTTSSS